jgi:integrase/recombinase XerD
MNQKNVLHIQQFIEEMQFRNYSPRSIENYSAVLSNLDRVFNISLEEITIEQFKKYLHQQITVKGISVSYVNQSISAFKIFQVSLLGREWEPIKIQRPRREKKLPVILSVNEVERLIVATKNIKHKAILMLAYSSGLRKMELTQMKPSAIDSERMQVHVVQGKGKKDRYTLLSPKVLELLRFYYKNDRPKTFLFEAQGNKGKALADRTIDAIIKKSSQNAGIKKDISFHTLRHCFATHLLESGVNLRLIQSLLGHTSIKTTSIYLHLANINPSSVISPLESMNV